MPACIFVCFYALRRISPKNSHLSRFPPTLMMVSFCELDYQFPNQAEVFSCEVQGCVSVFTLHTSLRTLNSIISWLLLSSLLWLSYPWEVLYLWVSGPLIILGILQLFWLSHPAALLKTVNQSLQLSPEIWLCGAFLLHWAERISIIKIP